MRSGVACVLVLALLGSACSDDEGGAATSDGGASGVGGSSSGDGGSFSGDGGSSSGDGGSSSAGPSTSGSSSTTTSGVTSSSATTTTSTATVAASTSSTGGGDDPYAAERQICIDKINALRATEGLPAYGRWGDAEVCSDGQATSDEQSGTPHGSFPGCGESAQNECLGHGPSGIEACLDQMWAEKDQESCAGCILCHDSPGNCPDCDFFGESGQQCGHYVNMSARYFSEAACGFSSLGGWDVQNFR